MARPAGANLDEVIAYHRSNSIEEGDCWLWKAACTPGGYGVVKYDGDRWYAHRLFYHHAFGLHKADVVHHKCGTRNCVKPAHLQKVSHHDNAAEMMGRKLYEDTIKTLLDQIAALKAEIERLSK